MTLTELLSELGIDYRQGGEHHHVSQGWVGIDCPYCSPSSGKFRLGINLTSWACTCWVCGRQWLRQALIDVAGESAAKHLRDVSREAPTIVRKAGRLKFPENARKEMSRYHREYLASRGHDPEELAKLWGLLFTGEDSDVPWHVVIPLTRGGRPVSWTARTICPTAKKRYKNARPEQEDVPAHECLYGADYVGNSVVIHEGPADVWRTGPGAVAIMGLNWSPAQLFALSSIPRRMVCLDSDSNVSRRKAQMLAADLSLFGGETVVCTLDAKDPGSAGESEIHVLRSFLRGVD